jgi:hemerythrin superfamily protein
VPGPVPNLHSGAIMPTNAKTKAKNSAERKIRSTQAEPVGQSHKSEALNAIELLEQDHREVEGLFEEYGELVDDPAKGELAKKICMTLTVHMQIEEEIFYPQARKATKDDDLLDEAVVEHAGAKNLIAEIEGMEAGEDLFDAKVKVLGEQIKHHVEEEEEELFPEVADTEMDLDAVGVQMEKRKAELLKQLAKA